MFYFKQMPEQVIYKLGAEKWSTMDIGHDSQRFFQTFQFTIIKFC